jgi:hypothetical protein
VVNLTWSPGTGGTPTSFNLYRGAASGQESATAVATLDGTTYSYQDTGLTNGTTYFYDLTATNGIGTSPNSNEVSAVPTPPSIALGPGNSGNTSATVTAGGAAVFNLTLTSVNYTGTVTYSCTGTPTGGTCAISPPTASLTLSTASAPVKITVQTSSAAAMFAGRNRHLLGVLLWPMGLLAVPLSRRRRLHGLAAALLTTVLLVAITACGSSSQPPPAASTYTLTVTATGTNGVAPATATLTLTVQP